MSGPSRRRVAEREVLTREVTGRKLSGPAAARRRRRLEDVEKIVRESGVRMKSGGKYFCQHEEQLDALDQIRDRLERMLVATERRIGALLDRCECEVPGTVNESGETRRGACSLASSSRVTLQAVEVEQ